MMNLRYILIPFAAIVLPLAASSAHAGIIVTVGRPVPVDLVKKTKATAGAYPTDKDCSTDRMCVVALDGKTNCPQVAAIDPLTGLPMGWMCRPIGSNQFYCDVPGRGAGADGEGSAGGFEETDAMADDAAEVDGGEEIEAFGCEAGGAGSGFGVVAALGALALMGIRRRRSAGR